MGFGNKFILFVCMFCCSDLWAQLTELEPKREYDITLDDGEMLKKAKVRSIDATTVSFELEGAMAPIKVPRTAIRKAVLRQQIGFFKGYELRLLGGVSLALADLKLLSNYFPEGSLGFGAFFSRRLPYLRISSVFAAVQSSYITDGERIFFSTAFSVGPQWRFDAFHINWLFGIGGGAAGLYLVSYNFTRFRPNPYFSAELGAGQKIARQIRLYILARGSWWPDSQANLFSLGVLTGISFEW